MAFARCGRPDPFSQQVRNAYRANVLRVPRAGVDPLLALAVVDRRVEPRGSMAGLLAGDGAPLPEPVAHAVTDLTGLRSTSVDLNIGVNLTTGFLAALGLPIPAAAVSATLLRGATSVQFEVRDVSERSVDLGAVGKALAGRTIDDNPATRVFLIGNAARLMLISRVLVSRHFAVHAASDVGQSADVSVDAIQDLIGEAQATVSWRRESADTLSFQGEEAVAFAFAAVPCAVQADRTMVFGVEADKLVMGRAKVQPQMKPVVEEDGLLDFDDAVDGTAPR